MNKSKFLHVLMAVLLTVSIGIVAGCDDDDPDIAELEAYNYDVENAWPNERDYTATYPRDLVITPELSTVSGAGKLVTLKATGGTPPYSWSVNDIAVGSIVENSGDSASYRSNTAGDENVVVVRDKTGQEAYATITQ